MSDPTGERNRGQSKMNDYFLSYGSHLTPEGGRCAMEFVSYLAGEPHSDSPKCVCPNLRRFCVSFNDGLPDDRRQKLRPYLARTIGTSGDGLSDQRAMMAADWLIRTYTPAWLSLAGPRWRRAVESLRSLPPTTAESFRRAICRVVPYAAIALGDAEAKAAMTIGRERDTTWNVTKHAARASGGSAAAVAAREIPVVWDAAQAVTQAVLMITTQKSLTRTVDELQRSAFDLLDRMLPLESVELPESQEVLRLALEAAT